MREHVPEDRGDSTHDRHTSNFRSTTQLDSPIPLSHFGIILEDVQYQLSEQKSSELAPLLGYRTQPILRLTGVSTAWRQPEIVGQTAWSREPFYGANAAR